MLRILHTSDWHLGKTLGGESLVPASEKALDWLLEICCDREVDCVLIAGDVFESPAPAPAAQRLYYRFLARAAGAGISVAVVPGNHDGADFLRAASDLLFTRGVFVAGEGVEDEALVLRNAAGEPVAGLAAVPSLTELEARRELSGAAPEGRAEAYAKGLSARFSAVWAALEEKLAGADVPRIALGHFYACGAAVGEAESLEELGGLPAVPSGVVGEGWDYVGLGHVHLPQALENPSIRYSGAPWPLSFKDAGRSLGAVIVTLGAPGEAPLVEPLVIPAFQPIVAIEGDYDGLLAALDRIARESPGAWVRATYTGVTERADLVDCLQEAAARLSLRLFEVSNPAAFKRAQKAAAAGLDGPGATPSEAFRQLLAESRENDAVLKQLAETFDAAQALLATDDAGGSASLGEKGGES